MVIDNQAKITLLKCTYFDEITEEKARGKVIMQSIISPIISISV